MKIVIMAVAVALLLSSVAFATGNWVTQSNSQSTDSNGWVSEVDQTSTNSAITIGDGNTVTQSNGQYADMEGTVANIYQDASNEFIAVGNSNSAWQDDLANAFNYGELGTISQTQANLGVVTGDWNTLDQSNNADASLDNQLYYDWYANADASADAEAYAYGTDPNTYTDSAANVGDINPVGYAEVSAPYITQDQSNTGAQIGDGNTMSQSNGAEASLDVTDTLVALASDSANTNANAVADSTSWPDWWLEDGWSDTGHAFANAYAYSTIPETVASAYGTGGQNSIDQEQTNGGMQTGDGNTLTQSNDANAVLNSVVYSNADAIASATASADASAESIGGMYDPSGSYLWAPGTVANANANAYADANAYAYAYADPISLDQSQSNLGAQIGDGNVMDQSNNANAKVDANVFAWAEGDAYANADATATTTSPQWIDWYGDYVWWVWSTAGANANANANAYANAYAYLGAQTIDQNQANAAVQVGTINTMTQNNNANDVIDATAHTDIWAQAGPDWVYGEGAVDANANAYDDLYDLGTNTPYAEADANANANANAYAYVGPNTLSDDQSNIGAQIGDRNVMNQNNNEAASIYYDNEYTNYFTVPSSDYESGIGSIYASASADASDSYSSYFDAGNSITQTQANLGTMIGNGDTISETNNANIPIDYLSGVNIDLSQTNNVLTGGV